MKDRSSSTTSEMIMEQVKPTDHYRNKLLDQKLESNENCRNINTSLETSELKLQKERSTKLSDECFRRKLLSVWENLDNLPETEKYRTKNRMTGILGVSITEPLVQMSNSYVFNGDSGISMHIKPEWLDEEKFRRGQEFARKHAFGIVYADLLSIFAIYSFKSGLKPIIMTGASSTPYTSFKRYLSTITRFWSWYSSDPWTKGTAAYTDMKTVRRLHAMVRKKIAEISPEEYTTRTQIENPWCPAFNITSQDFKSSCPIAATPELLYYKVFDEYAESKRISLTQFEMSFGQWAFFGLVIVYPKFFGIYAEDEELDAFCHMWRGIGYLLGIEDEFNFCRGTLEDAKERSRDFIEYVLKPNLRDITPEWEHMMRCVTEGVQYYFPGLSYESCLLDMVSLLDLQMPKFYNSLSYVDWMKYNFMRFYFKYVCRVPGVRPSINQLLYWGFDRAHKLDDKQKKEIKEKSKKTLESYKKQIQKNEDKHKNM